MFPRSGQPWHRGGVHSPISQLGWSLCAQDSSSMMSSPWKSPGKTIQGLGTCKQENVLAACAEKDDATLGKKADTSSCHRDPVGTVQPLRCSSPCRTWARGAERELQGLRSPWAPQAGCRKPARTVSAQSCWPGSKAGQGRAQPHAPIPNLEDQEQKSD